MGKSKINPSQTDYSNAFSNQAAAALGKTWFFKGKNHVVTRILLAIPRIAIGASAGIIAGFAGTIFHGLSCLRYLNNKEEREFHFKAIKLDAFTFVTLGIIPAILLARDGANYNDVVSYETGGPKTTCISNELNRCFSKARRPELKSSLCEKPSQTTSTAEKSDEEDLPEILPEEALQE